MKTITINIIKKSVMGLVEGISATIAKHNPEVDFQTIWASDSEEPVLDIHYREAITDLENFLARFTSETSGLFDLQAQADDFSLSIRTMSNWPPRLSGVLSNLVQNYLAHAMVAGWLSDFPDIKTADYGGMGVKDLDDIKELLLKKDFCFREVARGADTEAKVEVVAGVDARAADGESKAEADFGVNARGADGEAKVEAAAGVEARGADGESKVEAEFGVEARGADADAKVEAGFGVNARGADGESKAVVAADVEARGTDGEAKVEIVSFTEARGSDGCGKNVNGVAVEVRNGDRVAKDAGGGVRTSERNKDFMSQHFHEDRVDWGGGVATLDFV